ncbi:MAG TPA: sugar kinase [Thermoleophilaceae bacterium]|nr:sugar kinase [Thermoleophilaceae bacterium]
MTTAIVLGDVMTDVVARLSGPIAPGSDSPARVTVTGGGQAANTAAWLALTGTPTAIVGRVGDDPQGSGAAGGLHEAGIQTHLSRDPERPTGTCVVLVGPAGERTMFPDAGANDGLAPGAVPDELLVAGNHLHIAGYALLREGSRAAARSELERAVRGGLTVSADPSSAALLSPAFLDLADGSGLLLPNAEEAAALAGVSDPERAARLLAERVAEVVVKLGEEGALWTDGRDLLRVPAEPAGALVDTTGAGDAFAAGLIAARLFGAGPGDALRAGCRLAALAVATAGARPRLLE